MENLIIKATKRSPEICFDSQNHLLEIKGSSYPGNVGDFYEPVFSWIDNYIEQLEDQKVTVNLELIYFNSSSGKILFNFLSKLEEAVNDGKNISVNWIYEEDNEDMEEFGEEIQEDLEVLKLNMVSKEV